MATLNKTTRSASAMQSKYNILEFQDNNLSLAVDLVSQVQCFSYASYTKIIYFLFKTQKKVLSRKKTKKIRLFASTL